MKKLTTLVCTLVLSILLPLTVYAKDESITVKYEDYNNLSTEEKAKIEKGAYSSEVGHDNTVTLVYKKDDTKCKMPTPNTPKQPSPKGTVDTSETPVTKYVYLLAGSAFLIVIFVSKNRKVKQFALVLMTTSLLFAGLSTSLIAEEKAIGDVEVLDNLQLGEKVTIEPKEVDCYTYEGYIKVANTGSVIVKYTDLKGNEIHPSVTVIAEANVGTDYDTTSHKKQEITFENKQYQYDSTEGVEVGVVEKGQKVIVYKYGLHGDVVVRFFHKKTKEKVKDDFVLAKNAKVGETYNFSDLVNNKVIPDEIFVGLAHKYAFWGLSPMSQEIIDEFIQSVEAIRKEFGNERGVNEFTDKLLSKYKEPGFWDNVRILAYGERSGYSEKPMIQLGVLQGDRVYYTIGWDRVGFSVDVDFSKLSKIDFIQSLDIRIQEYKDLKLSHGYCFYDFIPDRDVVEEQMVYKLDATQTVENIEVEYGIKYIDIYYDSHGKNGHYSSNCDV